MKTYRIHLILAALAITSLNAQEGKPPGDRRPPPPPPLLLGALDTDKSGDLSEIEIGNASLALDRLDKDGDGTLSRKEMAPRPPQGRKPQGPPPPKGPPVLLRALDLDKDGVLSAAEIEDAPLSLAVLDTDEDGSVSREEMRPGKPPVKEPV